jgi:hypothetical protein
MVTSVRGGGEEEKEIQPDSAEEKSLTAISFGSMDSCTPPFEFAMLSSA